MDRLNRGRRLSGDFVSENGAADRTADRCSGLPGSFTELIAGICASTSAQCFRARSQTEESNKHEEDDRTLQRAISAVIAEHYAPAVSLKVDQDERSAVFTRA